MKSIVLTFLISMVPVIELRGAIPFGIAAGLSFPTALTVSLIGNIVFVPFAVLFIRKIFTWLKKKSDWLRKIVFKLEAKAEKQKEKVLRYEFWGLVILVAVPLPGTGAWTGSLVAAMLDMQLKRAVPAICLGVLIAGIIVTLATFGVVSIF